MKKEDFDKLLTEASKKYAKGTTAKRPESQFNAGARWAWEQLTKKGTEMYYEEQLREQIESRLGEPADKWMDQIITTTAQTLVDVDETREDIQKNGRTWIEYGYNMQQKRVSNPEQGHLKDLMRTLTTLYESLGLSYKTNPKRMTEPTKKGGSEHDKLTEMFNELR